MLKRRGTCLLLFFFPHFTSFTKDLYLLNLPSRDQESLGCDLFSFGSYFLRYLWDVESGASLFAGAPDEGGEGKELLISTFSPYLSPPAGAAAGGGQIKHEAYVHVRERGTCTQKSVLC